MSVQSCRVKYIFEVRHTERAHTQLAFACLCHNSGNICFITGHNMTLVSIRGENFFMVLQVAVLLSFKDKLLMHANC